MRLLLLVLLRLRELWLVCEHLEVEIWAVSGIFDVIGLANLGEIMPFALITLCHGTFSWLNRSSVLEGRCLRQMPTWRGR
jgi:hypothetical protein